jgi:hypothetical protein
MTLLILSCSQEKAPVPPGASTHFFDLYDGPMWRQVKGAGFPRAKVAALSALYGFMEPDYPAVLQSYDTKMDEERSARLCNTSCHVARLAQLVRAHGAAFIVGGKLYQEIARTAERITPELAPRLTYAAGSYLEQRKQLGAWLRAQLGTEQRNLFPGV